MKYLKLISKKNEAVYDEYLKLLTKVEKIKKEHTVSKDKHWCDFFYVSADSIMNSAEIEHKMSADELMRFPSYMLKVYNRSLTRSMDFEFCQQSFANIEYSTKCFGKKVGQLNAIFSLHLTALTKFAHEHMIFRMIPYMKLFCDYHDVYKKHNVDYDKFFNLLKNFGMKERLDNLTLGYWMQFSPDFDFYIDFIKKVDLTNLNYLYYYGNYVSEDDIRTATFLNSLPKEKIDRVMHQTAKAYIQGFIDGKKDYKKKKTVSLGFRQGMERLARSLILELENKYGLTVLIGNVFGGRYDQQFQYDHKYSNALFFDEAFVDAYLGDVEKAIETNKKLINENSGAIYFAPFGDKPFAPINKKSALKYKAKQMQLSQKMIAAQQIHISKYYKRAENSFCIIGFPTPEIGKKFEEIFDKTIDINMQDHHHWLKIQQHLIDALDTADTVHVKGCGKNKTDITVAPPTLKDPSKQTNFNNCGATVNIPVGEVFTSPQLKGTNGILHVPKTFLGGLLYKDLLLEFKDGYITKYSCKNFKTIAENKKYIEENLIFPHKSLPLGEFAIGTNTLAYAVAQKYKIMSVLPILIIEKMGPHFAIGDTCYKQSEDNPVYNPDGKEIVARDNEHSIVRKKDMMKAYTNVHTDITLPYEEIGYIQAVGKKGKKIDIIKNGKFVLKGLEELNLYLK